MVEIQIEGIRAIIGLDPDNSSALWTSDDQKVADDLNRYERFPQYIGGYDPNRELGEAQAVVKEASQRGLNASIVRVDQEEPVFDPDAIY